MKTSKKKNKSILLRIFVLGVCTYMIITLANLLNTLNKSRSELNALRAQYASEKNDIAELKAILSEGSENKMIEKAARERLGYVYSDEQVFIDISGN